MILLCAEGCRCTAVHQCVIVWVLQLQLLADHTGFEFGDGMMTAPNHVCLSFQTVSLLRILSSSRTEKERLMPSFQRTARTRFPTGAARLHPPTVHGTGSAHPCHDAQTFYFASPFRSARLACLRCPPDKAVHSQPTNQPRMCFLPGPRFRSLDLLRAYVMEHVDDIQELHA